MSEIRRGVIAICGLGYYGIVTSDAPVECRRGDERWQAWTGIRIDAGHVGEAWCSRDPKYVAELEGYVKTTTQLAKYRQHFKAVAEGRVDRPDLGYCVPTSELRAERVKTFRWLDWVYLAVFACLIVALSFIAYAGVAVARQHDAKLNMLAEGFVALFQSQQSTPIMPVPRPSRPSFPSFGENPAIPSPMLPLNKIM